MASAEPWPAARDAERSITDERYPSARPQPILRVHAYLTHPIEIKIAGRLKRVENIRAFPSAVSEALPQYGFLSVDIIRSLRVVIRKRKKEQCAVIVHSETTDLLAHLGIEDIDQFISWPVAFDLKGCNFEAKVFLKFGFGAKGSSRTRNEDHPLRRRGRTL